MKENVRKVVREHILKNIVKETVEEISEIIHDELRVDKLKKSLLSNSTFKKKITRLLALELSPSKKTKKKPIREKRKK